MDELIIKLETWLLENRADYFKQLNPPATDEELNELEQVVGIKIPTDFKKLYQWRNGQSSNTFSSLDPRTSEMFMEISTVIAYLDAQREQACFEEIEWRNSWLPFMHNGGGNCSYLDIKSGEVVYWSHEFVDDDEDFENMYDDDETESYASIKVWLEDLVEKLYTNEFVED